MAQGSRSTLPLLFAAVLLAFAGCAPHLPAASAAAPPIVTVADLPALTLRPGDLPAAYRLATDAAPTDAQLAALRGDPLAPSRLAQAGRLGGTYRVYAFTSPEPTDLNATVQITVEVDLFASPAGADAWFAARQAALAASFGAPLAAPAPGRQHAVFIRVFRAADIAATDAALAFTEGAVYVEIATTFVGSGVSIADATYYADLIDGRIVQPGG